ncbi:MAG: dihydrofolate reductase [Bacteroidota bacterium]|nr:dihydrofolate reductase [Bacteroidota bacterium]MDP4195342.1 dihydrofolate reductase [Bacteroidota bacterium]
MEKIIVVAVSKNGVIGKGGTIPWHSKEDMQYFKSLTMGFPVVMGRKTFESLKKPLKGRLNIVISRNKELKYNYDEVKVFNDLTDAYNYCSDHEKVEKIFIIGGAEIYKQAIKTADVLSVSRMDFEAEGDVLFPELDWGKWEEETRIKYPDFSVVLYVRKRK